MNQLPTLLDRLKQRKVVQWVIAYVAAAWLVLQVVGVLAQGFAWATPLLRVLTVLLALGVPVVFTFAWFHGERGRQRIGTIEILVLVVAVTVAGAATRALFSRDDQPSGAQPAAQAELGSIAVVPLDNFSGGTEDEALRGGITEEIINQLAQARGLKVISRMSTTALKARGLTLKQIADTLRVRHVLEGSVQRSGDRVRITLQLIDAQTDTHVWSETYTRNISDFFEIQEDIAAQVRPRIMASLDTTAKTPAAAAARNPEAYAAYLRGMHWKQSRSRAGLSTAIEELQRAIQLDSSYAPAYAALAAAHLHWGGYGYAGADAYTSIAKARILAEDALSRDPELPEGFAVRGLANLQATGDLAGATKDLVRAVQLRPGSAEFRNWYAIAASNRGDHRFAIEQVRAAVALDPIEPTWHGNLAWVALAARDYSTVLLESRLVTRLSPPSEERPSLVAGPALEVYALVLSGKAAECMKAAAGSPPSIEAFCLHALGRAWEAEQRIKAAIATGDRKSWIANYYAFVGDANQVVRTLAEAASTTPTVLDTRLRQSALYDRVRNDPVFKKGMRSITAQVRERSDRALRDLGGARGR